MNLWLGRNACLGSDSDRYLRLFSAHRRQNMPAVLVKLVCQEIAQEQCYTCSFAATLSCDKLPFAAGNKSAPIPSAQCWFPGLAISNAKI